MTTDEMILALVATGKFTLPVGLRQLKEHWHLVWPINRSHVHQVSPQHAHDLCAIHFAREVDVALCGVWPTVAGRKEWCGAMESGDSATAIKALHDAVIGEKP